MRLFRSATHGTRVLPFFLETLVEGACCPTGPTRAPDRLYPLEGSRPLVPRLAVYGHVNLDVLCKVASVPHPEGTVETLSREDRFGGTGGNIAAVAASLGAEVAVATFVGHDFPPEYRAHLTALGIDLTDLVVKTEYGTPTWWGFIAPDHTVVGVLDQGPMRDVEDFEVLTHALDDASYVHFATGRPGYYLRVADEARQRGIPVAFDPGQELLPLYDAEALEGMLERAAVAFFNNHEIGHALDKLSYGDPVQLLDHDLEAVVETRGAEGVRIHTDKEQVMIPAVAVDPDKVLDTTGAGDAFRAGWHTATQQGKPLIEACRYGSAAAAYAIQHVGGQGALPTMDELAPLLETLEV